MFIGELFSLQEIVTVVEVSAVIDDTHSHIDNLSQANFFFRELLSLHSEIKNDSQVHASYY